MLVPAASAGDPVWHMLAHTSAGHGVWLDAPQQTHPANPGAQAAPKHRVCSGYRVLWSTHATGASPWQTADMLCSRLVSGMPLGWPLQAQGPMEIEAAHARLCCVCKSSCLDSTGLQIQDMAGVEEVPGRGRTHTQTHAQGCCGQPAGSWQPAAPLTA